MNLNLLVKFADGTEKSVSANPADIVAFESKFDLSIAKLQNEIRLTHIFFLGWHAEKRTKSTDLDFETWLESIEVVELATPKK
jgi:hypothetical protein